MLPTPGSGGYGGGAWEEGGAGAGGGEGENGLTPLLSGLLTSLPGLATPKTAKDDLQGTISTLLSNAHSLQQLLGTLTANEQQQQPQQQQQQQQHPQQLQPPPQTQVPPPAPPLDAGHAALVSAATLLPPPHISTSAPPPLYPSSPLMSMLLTAAAQPAKPALLGDGPLRPDHPAAAYIPAHLAPPPMEQPPPPPPPVSSAPAFLFASPVTSRVTTSWSPPPMAPPPALLQPPILHPAALPPHPRLLNPLYLTPTKGMAPPAHSFAPAPPHAGYTTPIGHKRKSNHILPSPEPSPENGYVGQHSQGLGGHYQDSYLTKKLKKH